MIEELLLQSFGRFRNQSFPFRRTTLFYGPNEAGKTTVFDALLYTLCRPAASKTIGKILKERYGENLAVDIVVNDAAATKGRRKSGSATGSGKSRKTTALFDDHEYLNVYAIRSGDVSVAFDHKQDWLQRVKARLFSGNIDPGRIAAELDQRASNNKKLTHNKELLQKENELNEAGNRLETLRAEKARLIDREHTIEREAEQLNRVREEIVTLQEAQAEIKRQIQLEEMKRERERLAGDLHRLDKYERLEQELRKQSLYQTNVVSELDAINAALQKHNTEFQTARTRHADLMNQLNKLEEQKTETLKQLTGSRRVKELIAVQLKTIATAAGQSAATGFTGRLRLAAGIGLGMLGLGVTLLFSISTLIPQIVAALLTVLGGGLLIFVVWRALSRKTPDQSQLVQQLQAEWRSAQIEQAPPHGDTLEALRQDLERRRYQLDEWERKRESQEQALAEIQLQIQQRTAEMQTERETVAEQKQRMADWLQKQGVVDRDAYLRAITHYEQMLGEREQLGQSLAVQSTDERERLRSELERRLRNLDAEGILADDAPLEESAFRKLKARAEQIQSDLAGHMRTESRLAGEHGSDSGAVQATSDRLVSEIIQLEERVRRLQREIDAHMLDRSAAAIARDLFRELGEDQSRMLDTLLADVGRIAGSILQRGEDVVTGSDEEQAGLSSEIFRLRDAGGEHRSLRQLSSGTRDALVLALRIGLAMRSWNRPESPGFLVLDDPFLTLDAGRTEQCIRYLYDFQRQSNWQIVLFTKEAVVRDLCLDIFGNDCLEHNLSVTAVA
ncbi:MAG: AAA family ATPase [Leptospiraceae bacterium]|nr:AAA family ATPase [Leptospiraceae bacterium]